LNKNSRSKNPKYQSIGSIKPWLLSNHNLP